MTLSLELMATLISSVKPGLCCQCIASLEQGFQLKAAQLSAMLCPGDGVQAFGLGNLLFFHVSWGQDENPLQALPLEAVFEGCSGARLPAGLDVGAGS